MSMPTKTWARYLDDIRSLGERRAAPDLSDKFLADIELVDEHGLLTDNGRLVFRQTFVAPDLEAIHQLIHDALLKNPETLVVCQSLYGVPRATKANADSALRSHGFGEATSDRKLGTLLTILDNFGVISYVRGTVEVTDSLFVDGTVPPSVFISRETPYSNLLWLTRVLRECDDHIHWIDKHFMPAGLETIADAADGNRISEVQVLSLKLEGNSGSRVRRKYVNLQTELSHKGIVFEWRFIDSTLIRDTHDRWVVGQRTARNLPDVGTILSGNNSEISKSEHAERLNDAFLTYWSQATPF